MNRRRILGFIVSGVAALIGAVIGIPVLLAGLSPAWRRPKRGEPDWVTVGRMADFVVGTVQPADTIAERLQWPKAFRERAVFVWRQTETELVVFSRSCTDLGCALTYDDGSTCFFCPCHGGIFAQNGDRLAGPPDRPMDRYLHRLRDGILEIDLASVPAGA